MLSATARIWASLAVVWLAEGRRVLPDLFQLESGMISALNFPTGREEPEATRSNRRDACVFEKPCSAWAAARTKFCSQGEGDPLEPRAGVDLVVRPDSLVARASASFLWLIVSPFYLVSSYTVAWGHLSLQRYLPQGVLPTPNRVTRVKACAEICELSELRRPEAGEE